MAVASAVNRVSYSGNGSTVTPYAIPFRYDDAAWLTVLHIAEDGTTTTLTHGVDCTISGNGAASAGEVTTTVAIPAEDSLTVRRFTPAFQTLIPAIPLPLADLEASLDRTIMALQDRDTSGGAVFSKALTFPAAEPAGHDTVLPLPHLRKDSLIFFDPDTGEMALISKTALAALIAPLITGIDTSVFATTGGNNAFTGDNTHAGAETFNAAATFSGTLTANGKAVFAKQVEHEPLALTDGATITWDASLGNIATVTLGGNRTLANLTNLTAGKAATFTVKVTQDGTGSRTLAYGNAFKFPGGTAPVLSTAAGAVDILTFVTFSGTNLYLVAQKAFA